MKQVIICQNRTCRRQGAVKVLEAFRALSMDNVTIIAGGCLGRCGNGPMVLLLTPEQVWYSGVRPEEIPAIVKKHL